MARVEYSRTVTLQRSVNRRTEDQVYYKFSLVVPKLLTQTLGWEGGEELRASVENGSLVLELAEDEEGEEDDD